MKNKLLLFCFVLMCVLASCVSMSDRKINAPFWYFSPQTRAKNSEIAFVGVGKAANERQALLLAYSDINNRLYAYIGDEPSAESYRELSRSGKITAFDFEVIEKYQVQEDGLYTVYLLALGNNKTLRNFRSDAMIKESEIASQAEKLILEGDELIKSNQDILGLKKYIESMVLTYPITLIDDEYSFASIMNEILDIISTTTMTVVKSDSAEASCTVSVKRKSSLIPSRVINAPIKAVYKASDSQNSYYDDSFVYSSDNNGTISFMPKNHSIVKNGDVVFSFDLDRELRELARVSESAAKIITDAVEEKALVFNYKIDYGTIKIALSSFEYSVSGYYNKSDLINTYLVSRFEEDDVDSFVLNSLSDDNDDILLKAIHNESPDCDFALISRVGYSDYAESKTGTFAVTSEGLIRLYDLRSGQLVFDSSDIYSNGLGTSQEKALEDSYSNFAMIVYSIIKAFYV